MPRRRPPREGHVVNNFFLFAAAILLLPWLVEAQQQQRPAVQQRHESPHESNVLEVTKIPPLETPLTHNRRKNTLSVRNNNIVKKDVAIETLAPAETAVAAPPARLSSIRSAGLTSPHIARSLEDWEVEDFVLLATVDGRLHARDRLTGKEKWAFPFGTPMVETKYHRRNRSLVEEDYDPMSIDDYIWIVEPSRDGNLYIYRPSGPNPGLVNTGLTMKKLVEDMVPHGGEDPPVMYNGEKKTQMVTIDAYTGKVLNYYGPQGAIVNEQCQVSNSRGDTDECPRQATLTIGRIEYTVAIQGRRDGRHVATLTFSEWSPNNYDQDLQRQHSKSLDDQFIFPGHDGNFYGVDLSKQVNEDRAPRYMHKLTSPVVRVFDVAKAWGDKSDPELVILPQPAPPTIEDQITTDRRASSIFLNHTEDGSWFAMSGKTYPWAVQGSRQARINQQGWIDHRPQWDVMNNDQLSEALVGLHSIEGAKSDPILTIGGSLPDNNQSEQTFADNTPSLLDDPTWLQRLLLLPKLAAESLLEFIKNPFWIIILVVVIFSNQREIRSWVGRHASGKGLGRVLESREPRAIPSVDRLPEIPEDEEIKLPVPERPTSIVIDETSEDKESTDDIQDEGRPLQETAASKLDVPGEEKATTSPEKEKKKAHRGRRGGVKHKKGRATSQGASEDGAATPVPKPVPTVEDAVRDAQNLGQQAKMEPDIVTVPTDPTEVSGPILRIGALEVDQESCIGIGSNGTMVFKGIFDGREVAVKRMMIQFFDIASQETKLLRESDDHPNVIRYFAQQQAAGFLYIALELCPASLSDVIEKPSVHRDLAHAGERDLPNVLYQITNGLQHLHKLRIVHRDLKPANILVAMGKDGNPRLLVSDFGLCKKLEGEQSSFRATTAHAAGTSGWRAPELLLDDDAKDNEAHKTMVDASTDGNSGSIALNPDLLPNRRATRAIDIFSLGLVFFYVLTKGSHPFDCGDKYMREVNIRADKYNLDKLDVLGDYAFEARDLIASMLSHEPKQRPTALQVMAHPFFWSPKKRLNFLCDVSDHFEKEKRDPPTQALETLESYAPSICGSDFLKPLGKEFVESLGKQRKYTGTRLLDLLRALRNKKNHYEDMSDKLKSHVGALPDGYLSFWTRKFPSLLISCWNVVYEVEWDESDRFREYYQPAGL
ncbi:uncharacterized protein LY89DRAFT_312690 [Mollisia scopiformis]|uniref:non-specific serine/threonine protein kinase n=1 Tax=Mollisia scopiformis TaxID=149040 RepID=A0A194XS46_MOLSC|nr:uncharacterized protein LY89DRAFT_312690 [Mollisia scopiformis]KUJ22869.1 hypothetical protein LY89DRAFT_312690 [Mollisia scopiformis]